MSKSQIDGTSLLVAALAAALALTVLNGPFAWLGSIAGLVLVLILLGFDRDGYRSVIESLAYAAVFSLCLTVATAVLWRYVAENQGRPASFEGKVADHWLPLFWLGVMVVFWPIDRARMTGRLPALPAATGGTLSLRAPMRVPEPPPAFVPQPVPPPAPPPPAAAPPSPVVAQEAFTRPTFSQAVPEPAHAFSASAMAAAPAAPPAFVPPPPPAAPAHIPVGPETTIYVNLVGEGLNVLRGVRAESLGHDYYKIIDEMPQGETWQFGPGQVVRCKRRNLSSGKAMVAFEEAQRAS